MAISLLPDDNRGRPVPALRPGSGFVITLDATSTFATKSFESNIVRIMTEQRCWIRVDSTAAAATNTPLPANIPEYFSVEPGQTMHAIATATGRLWITDMF